VVTLEAPSATSVGLCLAHMVVDKRAWLERLGVDEVAWPMSGKAAELYVDNTAEFHSEALRRGCAQHGISLRYRPLGALHYGGVVERVIGTMTQAIHDELPGTTFSNPAQRGDYDADGRAVLTLRELQRWARFVAEIRAMGSPAAPTSWPATSTAPRRTRPADPPVRRLTGGILTDPAHLTDSDRALGDALTAACPPDGALAGQCRLSPAYSPSPAAACRRSNAARCGS
jgi:hypothetical protein